MSPAAADGRPRVSFVLEQTLGHVSFAESLRWAVETDGSVDAEWIPVRVEREARWERLPGLGSNWSVRASLKARLAVEARRRRVGPPDVHVFHTQVVSLLSSGLLRDGRPVVVSLDATPLGYDRVGRAYGHGSGSAPAEALKLRVSRRAFRHAAHLVTWSEWTRASLVEDYGVDAERVTVIPPGTNLALWRRPVDEPAPAGADGLVRLLFVGGDFRRKGGELLRDVVTHELAGRCELHVVTKSEDVRTGDGVVVHRGVASNSPRLRALFARSDVFVLPTEGDVHGIASIEAMAAGLPVVSTRVGAIPEVVQDGETGVLIAPGDGAALAGALATLIADADLRRRMGERGRQRAAEHFDALANGRRLAQLLRSLAGERAGSA